MSLWGFKLFMRDLTSRMLGSSASPPSYEYIQLEDRAEYGHPRPFQKRRSLALNHSARFPCPTVCYTRGEVTGIGEWYYGDDSNNLESDPHSPRSWAGYQPPSSPNFRATREPSTPPPAYRLWCNTQEPPTSVTRALEPIRPAATRAVTSGGESSAARVWVEPRINIGYHWMLRPTVAQSKVVVRKRGSQPRSAALAGGQGAKVDFMVVEAGRVGRVSQVSRRGG